MTVVSHPTKEAISSKNTTGSLLISSSLLRGASDGMRDRALIVDAVIAAHCATLTVPATFCGSGKLLTATSCDGLSGAV